jgi:hypothetical protein
MMALLKCCSLIISHENVENFQNVHFDFGSIAAPLFFTKSVELTENLSQDFLDNPNHNLGPKMNVHNILTHHMRPRKLVSFFRHVMSACT